MRIFKDNVEYQGTPEEIAEFMRLNSSVETDFSPQIDPYAPFPDALPLRDVVSESEELRAKLATDPNYNPHGGVVPSKESEELAAVNLPTAEKDTGVEYI